MPLIKSVVGSNWAISTGNPYAAVAAERILKMGGSAVDAAIAADAVLGVVEPMATSIGGDVLAMVVEPNGTVQAYNGTGRSPAALTADHVMQFANHRIPERHPFSVTTPGAVRGWYDLHQRYGKVEWDQLFDEAIYWANTGFEVAEVAAREWKIFDFVLHADPHCAELYRAGHAPVKGERFINPALGALLTRIAKEGWPAFYEGAIPHATEAAMQKVGGLLRASDFAAHRGNYCEPLHAQIADVTLYQCPPNTHGCAILEALSSLDTDVNQHDRIADELTVISATAKALATAAKTVCDSGGNTVCTVVVDQDGLAISLMSSIFKRFGSGFVVPEGGFVLQNRGFGFAEPGHCNGVAPAKRPYHTVVPGAATKNGQFYMGLGVVGGLMQPQGQIQILNRVLRWHEPLDKAVFAPRWRLEAGNSLAIENGTCSEFSAAYRASGYGEPAAGVGDLAGRSDFGGAQVVMRTDAGQLWAVSDTRKDGVATAA